MAAAALICVMMIAGKGEAVAPPGQDHAWNVTFSATAAGAHPDITSVLNMCTDATGLAGMTHECDPAVPAAPLFDLARISYTGLRTEAAPVGSRIGRLTIDTETNAGALQNTGDDNGQPVPCGSIFHGSLPAFDIWAGAKTGPVVSMDPSPVNGYTFDQLDDQTQFDPTPGSVEGDGWPAGIRNVPSVIPAVLARMGLPDSAVINRGYGVASGLTRTSISLLTVFNGSQPGTDATTTLVIFGNPFGAQSAAKADTLNCAPFSSTLVVLGLTEASSGSKAINGSTIGGDFNPPAPGGATVLTICDATTPVGATCAPAVRSYSLAISTSGDDDGDGVSDAVDDCPTVADSVQVSFAGIGDACGGPLGANAGAGYDNNDASAIAAFSAAACSGLPHTAAKALACKDVDGDGVKNGVDNCPFAPNAAQQNRDGDSRGDACEGNGTDPALGFNQEGATPGDYSGVSVDADDRCDATYSVGGPTSAVTTCLSFTPAPGPGGCCTGPGNAYADANDDGTPDFLRSGGVVSRDHRSDSNGDGYSDADEGTPANCGGAGCAALQTLGAQETPSCGDAGRNCAAGAASPLGLPRTQASGAGSGCAVTVDVAGPASTLFLGKSDIDLDGDVTVLDLMLAAAWFGDKVGAPDDPRWEANMDADAAITILDLAIVASNFLRNVSGGCGVF